MWSSDERNRLRWRELTWQERGEWFLAWLSLPAIAIAVRLVAWTDLQDWLSRQTPLTLLADGTIDRTEEAQHVARLVQFARAKHLIRFSSLTRCITLWWLLRRRGIDSHIRTDPLDHSSCPAHTWITCGETVLDES